MKQLGDYATFFRKMLQLCKIVSQQFKKVMQQRCGYAANKVRKMLQNFAKK
jgi:hypothetical protein